MTPYVIYDPATGEITQSGYCPSEADVETTVGDQPHLIAWGEARTHYVRGGTVFLYTAEEQAAKRVPQMTPCRWNNATMAYEPIPRS